MTTFRLPTSIALASLLGLLALGCGQPVQPLHPSIVEITKNENPTKFVGEGRLSHEAEYVEFSLSIHSECFATALEASQATDIAVAKVMKNLKSTMDASNAKDGLFTNGGFSEPFTRYLGNNRRVCNNTFQKTAQITLKTSKIDAFSSGFDEIQRAIFSTMAEPSDKSREVGITFATLSKPQTRLYYETRERLEQEALGDALKNARQKFETASKLACGISGYKILSFVESSASAARPIPYGRSTPSPTGEGLVFDAIWVNKLLDVSFHADSATCRVS